VGLTIILLSIQNGRESMKLFPKLLSSLLVFMLAAQVIAEGETTTAANNLLDETPEQGVQRRKLRRKDLNESVKDYQPVSIPDPELDVNNFSYVRNFGASGRGEFLNVSFDLANKTTRAKEYLVYVLAAYENEVPVGYPSSWRKKDPQRNIFLVPFQKLSPEPLDEKVVLGDKATAEREGLRYKSVFNQAPLREFENEPTLEGYDHYLIKNPDKALKVKVYGYEAPLKSEQILSNLEVKKEETDRDVQYATENHTYTVQNNKYFTTVTTHHFSKFRENYLLFNRALILVFDPSRPASRKLVYRSLQKIDVIKHK